MWQPFLHSLLAVVSTEKAVCLDREIRMHLGPYVRTIRVNTFLAQLALACSQLNSSGLGSLNGRGLRRFLGAGGFDFLCLGIGRGLGRGRFRHTASPTTSQTRMVAPTKLG